MHVEIIKNPQIAAMSSRLSAGGKNVPIYKKKFDVYDEFLQQ